MKFKVINKVSSTKVNFHFWLSAHNFICNFQGIIRLIAMYIYLYWTNVRIDIDIDIDERFVFNVRSKLSVMSMYTSSTPGVWFSMLRYTYQRDDHSRGFVYKNKTKTYGQGVVKAEAWIFVAVNIHLVVVVFEDFETTMIVSAASVIRLEDCQSWSQ